ncbi:DUF4860 domain-containing protein [Fusibacter bizertensis]
MIKLFRKQEGYSLIEMSIVMMLLLLFGLGIFMLAAASTSSYQTLVSDKDDNESLRIASSYIITKLRQNDQFESVEIANKGLEGKDALVIKEELAGDLYETWIYESNGVLREVTVLSGTKPTDDLSFEIADVDKLKLSFINKTIYVSIEKNGLSLSDLIVTLKSNVLAYKE